MTTFDEVLVKASSDFMDKAKKDGKPFFGVCPTFYTAFCHTCKPLPLTC
jgi:hypothetical protein